MKHGRGVIENMNAATAAMNPELAKEFGIHVDISQISFTLEAKLQEWFEKRLRERGYPIATAEEAVKLYALWLRAPLSRLKLRGYTHRRPNTKEQNTRQTFKPDIEVISFDTRKPPLEIELKIRKGKNGRIVWRPGQKEMVDMGLWKLGTTPAECMTLLDRWEEGR